MLVCPFEVSKFLLSKSYWHPCILWTRPNLHFIANKSRHLRQMTYKKLDVCIEKQDPIINESIRIILELINKSPIKILWQTYNGQLQGACPAAVLLPVAKVAATAEIVAKSCQSFTGPVLFSREHEVLVRLLYPLCCCCSCPFCCCWIITHFQQKDTRWRYCFTQKSF
jgi:hypothetical protein